MMSLIEQVCPRLKCLCIFSDYPVPEKAMMLIGSLLRPVFHSLVVFSGRVLGCSRADGTADKDMDSLLKLLKWDESGDDESQEGVTGAEEKKLEEIEEKKPEEKKGETKEETKPAEEEPAEEKKAEEEKEPAEEKKAEEEKEPEEKEKAEEKKPEEQKVEEKPEEKEEKGTPDLEVKNNGIEIKMWMKCEEGSCVLDMERSGSYDSFNDLTDCETSVKVKCRNRTYSVPMPKSVDKTILVSSIVSVSVATVCER